MEIPVISEVPEAPEADKTVFAWNNEAVVSLQQGDYDEAISKLQSAISALRATARDNHGFRLSPATGYGSQADNEVLEDVSIYSVPISLKSTDSDNLDTDMTLFRPFDNAFITPYWNYQGPRGLALTWSFLLYNLALCYHSREVAKTGGNGSGMPMDRDDLRRATGFYNRALGVLQRSMGDGRPENVTILLLALYTNLGNLYSYFGMPTECQHCYSWIRSLLATHQQLQPHLGVNTDIAFFHLNLVSINDSVFQKAAAA